MTTPARVLAAAAAIALAVAACSPTATTTTTEAAADTTTTTVEAAEATTTTTTVADTTTTTEAPDPTTTTVAYDSPPVDEAVAILADGAHEVVVDYLDRLSRGGEDHLPLTDATPIGGRRGSYSPCTRRPRRPTGPSSN